MWARVVSSSFQISLVSAAAFASRLLSLILANELRSFYFATSDHCQVPLQLRQEEAWQRFSGL